MYSTLAATPFYQDMNRPLVQTLDWKNIHRVLDLACGTGTISAQILSSNPACQIIAIDSDELLLEQAANELRGNEVRFILGRVEDLRMIRLGSVDAVIMANALHLIPDKEKLLMDVRSLLAPGGAFAFNTMFYLGAEVAGTRRFYVELILEALRYVQRRRPHLRRVIAERTAANMQLSAKQLRLLVEEAGFQVSSMQEEVIYAPKAEVKLLLQSPMFVRGALPGFPAKLAGEALTFAADKVSERHALEHIPRRHLTMAATKLVD